MEDYEDRLSGDSVEELRFIDDIVNIARSHEADIRSMTSLEDFTLARYKNNWDDLDELCTELSARSELEKTVGTAPDGGNASFPTDTETDVCENDSLECELFNSNNNNNIITSVKSNVLVPPPRRKKMAKLKAAEQASGASKETEYTVLDGNNLQSESMNNTSLNLGTEKEEKSSEGLRVRTVTSDLSRDCPDKFDKSRKEGVANVTKATVTNEYGEEKKISPHENREIKAVVNGYSDCFNPPDDVSEENKNSESDDATCYTGLKLESKAVGAFGNDSDSVDTVSDNRKRQKHSADSVSEDSVPCVREDLSREDNIPDGYDSEEQGSRRSQNNCSSDSEFTDSCGRFEDEKSIKIHAVNDGEDNGLSAEVSTSEGAETDDEKTQLKSDSESPSEDNTGKYRDDTKTNSIYIGSSDLQKVDETLVVRPAVRRLSTSYRPPSDNDEAGESTNDSKRLRRHSTAAIAHQNFSCDAVQSSSTRTRSKSVTDLTTVSANTSPDNRPVRRRKSISNRVFSAVGKLSLRVKDAFKQKPTSQFYVDVDIEDDNMSRSDFPPREGSKPGKKHSSHKLYMEEGDDYPITARPVHTTQPADVETVHSYPSEARNPKTKGKFSSLFGLSGKKWYTISSLPKLLHLKRKPKDKYAKGDGTFEGDFAGSVASVPVARGKSRFLVTNGRYAANAKDRIAKDRVKRYDADSSHDLPTFISLGEYRRRIEEAEFQKQKELAELEKRQGGMGNRSRSMPYLDTSDEEEQELYNTLQPDYGRKSRPKSYEDSRYRKEKEQRRVSEPVDKGDRRRRYKRREKYERYPSDYSYDDVDKSTMTVDYGYDIYHFPNLRRPQSTSDLTFNTMGHVSDDPYDRYSTQPRSRNSVAVAEDRGRRRLLQPRDRNSIAVASGNVQERWKKERLPRPKSMSALPAEESLSSEDDSARVQRRRGQRNKPKAPSPPDRSRDSSPEIDPLEDAIQKHLKHERGPLARRKIERKRSQESGSMRRLKESFMAKRIWENVYDQLLKDLSTGHKSGKQDVQSKKAIETKQDPDEKSSPRTDDGYYSRCSSHSSREESDPKGISRSTSIEEERQLTKLAKSGHSKTKRIPRSESSRDHLSQNKSKQKGDDTEDDDFDTKRETFITVTSADVDGLSFP